MGYLLELNCILRVPRDAKIDLNNLKVGQVYELVKDGERIFPLNIPIEITNTDYKYFGKIAVRELTLIKGKTKVRFEVLKVFDEKEQDVYTKNFIK